MNKVFFYKLLENPLAYKLSQLIFAPGSEYVLTKRLKSLSEKFSTETSQILDVGCGPASWLWRINFHPVGLDLLHNYSKSFRQKSKNAVTGSAMALPFADNQFSNVFSLGVLHHLDDSSVIKTLQEMIRVCKPEGYVIVLDAVLPQRTWCRPLARLIRLLDKGCNMRTQTELKLLLRNQPQWKTRQYTYAATGLEMLECIYSPATNKTRLNETKN